MNPKHLLTVALCALVCGQALSQEMDKELSDLATRLAALTKDSGKKKVTVLDFTDLQGNASELGKYVAEELTVNLVMVKKDFAVLDRANLRKILAEHKLTATGLVDPENAKKLGQFAGVDALILGTIIPRGSKVTVTAKIISTDTAEIVGAARTEFKSEESVQQLLSKVAEATSDGKANEPKKDEKKVVKSFNNLQVELQPLQIVNGYQYLLTLTLTNTSLKKSIWVAVVDAGNQSLKGVVTDRTGSEFTSGWNDVSGIAASYEYGNFSQATEIKTRDSITATIKFGRSYAKPIRGSCRLQLALLLSDDFNGRSGTATTCNLVTTIETAEQ